MYNLNGGHLLGCCFFFAMPWLPASAQTSLYAQFLSTEFKAPSSFSNYIGGVKTLHIMLEQTFQCFTAIELKMALRGIARLNPLSSASRTHHTRYFMGNLSHFRFKFSR